MNILALCQLCPNDPTNGGALRLWSLCREGRVSCLYLERRTTRAADISGNAELIWADLRIVSFEEMLDRAIKHRASGGLLFAQGLEFASRLAMKHVVPDVVDVVDSNSLYFERRFNYLPLTSPARKLNALVQSHFHRRAEHAASCRPWTILAASAEDAARFDGFNARAIGLPNGTSWSDLPTLYRHRKSSALIGFHGGMTWDPNVSAAEFIARTVMPLVLRRTPQARLKIFGGPLTARIEALRGLAGVEIMGPVKDIRAALAEVDVYLMPMLQGSGVKNKLMEAMAAGLPVVTNPLGIEAFNGIIGGTVRIGTTASELASHVINLIEDSSARKQMSVESRAFAVRHFSPRRLEARLVEIISHIHGVRHGERRFEVQDRPALGSDDRKAEN